jgi:alkylation response protein AidB-like acyl-CoA dehydrogenase
MQIHGGMGNADEFGGSRHFVDARVFSIFEVSYENLALKAIARRLMGWFSRDCASTRPDRRS